MTLGNKIKKARKARGLSLQALADLMDVSRQLVWQWEKGDTDPRKHIEQLCHHLQVPLEYFYAVSSENSLESKIRRLDPEKQSQIEGIVNALLLQQEQEGKLQKRSVK